MDQNKPRGRRGEGSAEEGCAGGGGRNQAEDTMDAKTGNLIKQGQDRTASLAQPPEDHACACPTVIHQQEAMKDGAFR